MADPSPSATLRQLAEAATPGPWTYRAGDGMVRDAEEYHIVRLVGSPSNPELAASCRLIALAPALAEWAADAAETLAKMLEGEAVSGLLITGQRGCDIGPVLVGQEPTA